MDDQKRPTVKSNFIPLRDMDWGEGHNQPHNPYQTSAESTATLVTRN